MVQGTDLFISLFNNLALFIALITLYRYVFGQFEQSNWIKRQFVLGCTFGLFAIGCMHAKIPVFEGVIVDQRNAVVALSGAFGGPFSALTSVVFAAGYRIHLGGGGVLAGTIGICLSAVVGMVLNRIGNCFVSIPRAIASSLAASVFILPGFMFVNDFHTGWELTKAMAVPFGTAIFIAIFLVGLLLNREEERHAFERSFREREKQYRELVEGTEELISNMDRDANIVFVNHVAEMVLGRAPAQCIGVNWTEFIHPEDLERTLGWYEECVAAGTRDAKFENRVLNAVTGDVRTLIWAVTFHYDDTDALSGFSCFGRDVTEYRRVEEASRREAARNKTLMDISSDGIVIIDKEHRIIKANAAFLDMLGYSAREIMDLHTWDYEANHSEDDIRSRFAFPVTVPPFETRHRRKDGSLLDVEVSVVGTRIDDDPFAIAISRDITERKRVENELVRMRKYLSNVLDSMPSLLVGVDQDGYVTMLNHTAEESAVTTREHAVGKKVVELFPWLEPHVDTIQESIGEQAPRHISKVLRYHEGEARYENITIFPLSPDSGREAVVRVDNVSRSVQLEKIMVQSEKMMSIGGLAAGMAHEINNPLAAIMGYAHNIRKRIREDLPKNRDAAAECGVSLENVGAYLEKREITSMLVGISESGKRAAGIVRNMLEFSRKSENSGAGKHRIVDLLEQAVALAANVYDMQREFDFRLVEIIREYADDLPEVECDGNELQQVFLNLLKNGTEAMAEKDYADQSPVFILRVYRKEDTVVAEIEDNGPGMPEQVARRIFEPFFTTKPVGKGTGLGLSVSYFIVADLHKGGMEVQSEEGRWTRFTIRLPINFGGDASI